MGDMEKFEVIMAQIPTKELCGLQANVMKEVKYRASADETNFEVGRGFTKMIQIICDQLNLKNE
jgi:hypothetical protein